MFKRYHGFPEPVFFSTEPSSFNQQNADFQPHFDAGTSYEFMGPGNIGDGGSCTNIPYGGKTNLHGDRLRGANDQISEKSSELEISPVSK